MAAKAKPIDTDNLVKLHAAGLSAKKIARQLHVRQERVVAALKDCGIVPADEGRRARTAAINWTTVIARYRAGDSLKSLAGEFGVSRTAIAARLKSADVDIRGRSDAERLKWKAIKTDRSAVERQCSAAWSKSRGRIVARDSLICAARTRYERLRFIHRGENEVASAMRERGLKIEQQFPVDGYNIDIAIPARRIAVEIVGSNWHPGGAEHRRKRLEYLLDRGWLVVFVFIWRREPGLVRPKGIDGKFLSVRRMAKHFVPGKIADYFVALAQKSGRNKAFAGKYGVIDGHAENVAAECPEFNGFARIG